MNKFGTSSDLAHAQLMMHQLSQKMSNKHILPKIHNISKLLWFIPQFYTVRPIDHRTGTAIYKLNDNFANNLNRQFVNVLTNTLNNLEGHLSSLSPLCCEVHVCNNVSATWWQHFMFGLLWWKLTMLLFSLNKVRKDLGNLGLRFYSTTLQCIASTFCFEWKGSKGADIIKQE